MRKGIVLVSMVLLIYICIYPQGAMANEKIKIEVEMFYKQLIHKPQFRGLSNYQSIIGSPYSYEAQVNNEEIIKYSTENRNGGRSGKGVRVSVIKDLKSSDRVMLGKARLGLGLSLSLAQYKDKVTSYPITFTSSRCSFEDWREEKYRINLFTFEPNLTANLNYPIEIPVKIKFGVSFPISVLDIDLSYKEIANKLIWVDKSEGVKFRAGFGVFCGIVYKITNEIAIGIKGRYRTYFNQKIEKRVGPSIFLTELDNWEVGGVVTMKF